MTCSVRVLPLSRIARHCCWKGTAVWNHDCSCPRLDRRDHRWFHRYLEHRLHRLKRRMSPLPHFHRRHGLRTTIDSPLLTIQIAISSPLSSRMIELSAAGTPCQLHTYGGVRGLHRSSRTQLLRCYCRWREAAQPGYSICRILPLRRQFFQEI